MRSIHVEVCVCTQCVMHGAMDIIEAIEGLDQLKYEMRHNARIGVTTVTSKHEGASPVVYLDGVPMEDCSCESVMEAIIFKLH